MKRSSALILSSIFAASISYAVEPNLADSVPGSLTLETTGPAPLALAQAAAEEVDEQPVRKPDIHFVPTPQKVVDEMLATAKVQKGEMVYDLGCGDGRIVITAAKEYGAKGIGIDIDPKRIREATANAKAAGVEDRVEFRKADIFESDFKDADVISLYLLTTINRKLRPKILAETKPGTRVVSHAFAMGEWEPDAEKTIEGSSMFYWVVPANISGTWNVKGVGEPKVESATINQSFQKFTGTAKVNGQDRKIAEGQITGTDFTFMLEPDASGGQPAKIVGKIKGDQIEARAEGDQKTTWTAERDPFTKGQIAANP